MQTKIIAAFPGTGKTHYFHNHSNCLDSDSSDYSWIKDESGNNTKERNPDFPSNYIQHIKDNIGNVEYIFVSSHDVVRNALVEAGIYFYFVYPNIDLREEYLERFRLRNSPEGFINLLNLNWDNWIVACDAQRKCRHIELESGQFISDVI